MLPIVSLPIFPFLSSESSAFELTRISQSVRKIGVRVDENVGSRGCVGDAGMDVLSPGSILAIASDSGSFADFTDMSVCSQSSLCVCMYVCAQCHVCLV